MQSGYKKIRCYPGFLTRSPEVGYEMTLSNTKISAKRLTQVYYKVKELTMSIILIIVKKRGIIK